MTQTKVRVFLDGKEDDELKLDELPKEATVRELKKAIQEQCAKMVKALCLFRIMHKSLEMRMAQGRKEKATKS